MGAPERRERERQRRRETILQAATVVFAEQGVDGASMEAIAERAELSKALLYYYFPDKKALHEATAVVLVEHFFEDLSATAPPSGQLPEVFEALLGFYLERFRAQRHLLAVMKPFMGHGVITRKPETTSRIVEAHRPWMERMAGLLPGTPWADDPRGFQAFLFDVTVILRDLCMNDREAEAADRVRFYTDLVRLAAQGARS